MSRVPTAAVIVSLVALWGTRPACAQHGHGAHPPMPGQQYLVVCRLLGASADTRLAAPLEMPTAALAARLQQEIALPDRPALRVTQYLPQAELKQDVVPAHGDDAARPAILLAIVGPKQSFNRWLVAGDDERNRLTSFIGTWRYMTVQDAAQRDALFALFEGELTRPPTLRVTRLSDGKNAELPATVGASSELADLGCRVQLPRFVPHFAMDKSTGQPVSQSDKRVNPAALVVLEADGRREERWVFAKFPEFKMNDQESLPYRVTLDCPTESEKPTPDYAVVTIGGTRHEAWSRHEGKTSAQPLAEATPVSIAGSRYAFHIEKFIPAGRLIENFVEVARGGAPAIKVESARPDGPPAELWIPLGKQRTLATPQGPVLVSFELATPTAPGSAPHP